MKCPKTGKKIPQKIVDIFIKGEPRPYKYHIEYHGVYKGYEAYVFYPDEEGIYGVPPYYLYRKYKIMGIIFERAFKLHRNPHAVSRYLNKRKGI